MYCSSCFVKSAEYKRNRYLWVNLDAGDDHDQRGLQINQTYLIHPFNVHYTGEWRQGVPHGIGEIVLQNNSILKGTFVQGVASGRDCILVMDDESYYRGGIQNNQFQGQGHFYTPKGHIFKGQWRNNVPNGRGQQQFENGEKYQGNFQNGVKSDLNGTYTWRHHPDLMSYVGEFRNGRIQGQGTLFTRNGALIKGIFNNSTIQNATITNVRQYNYRDGGENNSNNVISYEGRLINGKLDGLGKVIKGGKQKQGIWFQGSFLLKRDGFRDEQIRKCVQLICLNFQKQTYEEQAIENIVKKLGQVFPKNNYEAKLILEADLGEFENKMVLIADMRNKYLAITKSEK